MDCKMILPRSLCCEFCLPFEYISEFEYSIGREKKLDFVLEKYFITYLLES